MQQVDASQDTNPDIRHNFVVNVADGAFFGMGLGLASFVTVIPLFIASLTDSSVLIGLVATIHLLGWQLPQVLTSDIVSRLRRYKPMVLFMTFHERWPFLILGLVALMAAQWQSDLVLVLSFFLISLHALGGGATATAWQSMIGKIMPPKRRGTFYGLQSAAANMMASVGSVLAGVLLVALPYPMNFAACFFLAGTSMFVSMGFLAATREDAFEADVIPERQTRRAFMKRLVEIIRDDVNFRWFLLARALSQFAQMGLAFFTIYAVRAYGMDNATAGVLTGVLLLAQTVSSPVAGLIGDRWGHRKALAIGNVAMSLAALMALVAPDLTWFYLVFVLAGIVNGTTWTATLAIAIEFGPPADKPFYIGLTNTLTAPATLIAPIVGGLLADSIGFNSTFTVSIVAGLVATFVLLAFMHDPSKRKRIVREVAPAMGD